MYSSNLTVLFYRGTLIKVIFTTAIALVLSILRLKYRLIHKFTPKGKKSLKLRLNKKGKRMEILQSKGMIILTLVVIQTSQMREMVNWGLLWHLENEMQISGKSLPKPRFTTRKVIKVNYDVEDGESKTAQKANNKRAHSTNGNRKMIVMQLNKGSSHFPTKAA